MLDIGNLYNEEFHFSFRCYYANGVTNDKHQVMKLAQVPKWIDGYKFTHPACTAITVKIWFNSPQTKEQDEQTEE